MTKRGMSFAIVAALAVMALFGLTTSNAVQAQDRPITFLTSFADQELEAFRSVMSTFEEQSGIEVEVQQAGRDMATVLNTRINAGNPPDMANVPNPGLVQDFARNGDLADMEWFRDTEVFNAQPESFIETATVEKGIDGSRLFGVIPAASMKSLVWYNKPVFEEQGYEIPRTLEELRSLEQQMLEDGFAPWCIGVESGEASGWPGTDWMEDIALREFGADFYDAWVSHDIPWTDDRVGRLFELFGTFANDEKAFGGTQNILATNFGDSVNDMFADPPRCLMHRQATFIQDFILNANPDFEAGEEFDAFIFPSFDDGPAPVLFAGDTFIAFEDNDRIRELVQFWASAEAQAQFAQENPGRLAVNQNVGFDVYPNPIIRNAAQRLQEAELARFDGSDMMPPAVGSNEFFSAVLDFLSGTSIDQIQQTMEAAADEAYEFGEATD